MAPESAPDEIEGGFFIENNSCIRPGGMVIYSVPLREYPGVAKFGIAPEWGSGGRWFKSSHSDHAECSYSI
jgi:hypothetical protein